MVTPSKTIAGTFVDLLLNPDKLAAAQAELEERTNGGIGGDDWTGPLLNEDIDPPVDLPWPEYVEIPRDRE